MNSKVFALIEGYLDRKHASGEIHVNDGDSDLVTMHIVDAIEPLSDPEKIRKTIKAKCYEEADAGMLGHPEVHSEIADLVINARS